MAESMITTSAWVPRGFAAPFPSRYNFDETEFERIAELAKIQLDDANDDLEEARAEEEGASEDIVEDGDTNTAAKNSTPSKKNNTEEYVS
jgi:periodic tryptophan protein 1